VGNPRIRHLQTLGFGAVGNKQRRLMDLERHNKEGKEKENHPACVEKRKPTGGRRGARGPRGPVYRNPEYNSKKRREKTLQRGGRDATNELVTPYGKKKKKKKKMWGQTPKTPATAILGSPGCMGESTSRNVQWGGRARFERGYCGRRANEEKAD